MRQLKRFVYIEVTKPGQLNLPARFGGRELLTIINSGYFIKTKDEAVENMLWEEQRGALRYAPEFRKLFTVLRLPDSKPIRNHVFEVVKNAKCWPTRSCQTYFMSIKDEKDFYYVSSINQKLKAAKEEMPEGGKILRVMSTAMGCPNYYTPTYSDIALEVDDIWGLENEKEFKHE